eukprot:SAG22_NODE_6392_length_862_cov_1.469201_1_plen_229_part_00
MLPEGAWRSRLQYILKKNFSSQWHVGFADHAALPTARGWDKAYNFFGGGMDYYTKIAAGPDVGDNLFLDVHAMGAPDRTPEYLDENFYAATIWEDRIEQVIAEHAALGTDQPLFAYYAMQSPHDPMQVPDEYRAAAPCDAVPDTNRQIFCGMVRFIDQSVARVHTLMAEAISPDFLFVFMSDNGGNPGLGGYNMPMRGAKGTTFEGGKDTQVFLSPPFLLHQTLSRRG